MTPDKTPDILNVFENFRMSPVPGDQYEEKGKRIFSEKLAPYVGANKPLPFVMLGFPMKSPNDRDKVLGKLPDLGEQAAMEQFATFATAIKSVYEPGIKMSIVSDGYAFNKILDTPDSVVEAYNEVAQDMARIAPIKWFQMTDFYDKKIPLNSIREKITEQFGISPAELDRRILFDTDVNSLYKGMIQFLSLDLAIKSYPSNNKLHKDAKRAAREMMFINEAYSALIQSNFKNDIRLSMHPSINNGVKYSFQLIPGGAGKIWTSPWHCALLVDKEGAYSTIHRKDAMAAGHNLVTVDGRPFYFTEN